MFVVFSQLDRDVESLQVHREEKEEKIKQVQTACCEREENAPT